jgi:hypothetical protein
VDELLYLLKLAFVLGCSIGIAVIFVQLTTGTL